MNKEDVVYIYAMEYYLALKKSEPMPFAVTRVHLEIIILSKVSQKEIANTIWYHLYVELKTQQTNIYTKKR